MNTYFKNNLELIPVIVQDEKSGLVRMLGYMNNDAYEKTIQTGFVWFYSRSKQRLWMKGETSGHRLKAKSVLWDCDKDAILILAEAQGPTCHTGKESCFDGTEHASFASPSFLYVLQNIIEEKWESDSDEVSYTKQLKNKGIPYISRKIGEEAVECMAEALQGNTKLFLEESADLIYHWMVLLKAMKVDLKDVEIVLKKRHYTKKANY